jgi:hypothetical protein
MVKIKSQLKKASDLKKEDYGFFFASADGQALQRRDLVDDVQLHRGLLSWGLGNGQPVWTVSLVWTGVRSTSLA